MWHAKDKKESTNKEMTLVCWRLIGLSKWLISAYKAFLNTIVTRLYILLSFKYFSDKF